MISSSRARLRTLPIVLILRIRMTEHHRLILLEQFLDRPLSRRQQSQHMHIPPLRCLPTDTRNLLFAINLATLKVAAML